MASRVLVTGRFQTAMHPDLPYRLSSLPLDHRAVTYKKDFYMKNKRARDSVSGRFIPLEEARKRPRETTVETVKKPGRRKNDK
ncbi:competence protein CinA [Pseudomonas syringae]|nr:competence protein CinA [Pseudomonas syringae]MBS7424060.1 competence protein CinA [Pseudomonas syringae]QVI83331.1 competence protein CinA [Pseudomonas syringae]